MAKIYVASNDLARARKVMDELTGAGHTITFDWVVDIEDQSDNPGKAFREREAIRECDILVYLWASNQESARFEAGMAMGLGKKIIVSSDHQAWFFALPEVVQVNSDDQIMAVVF
jgi:hypothetical protein